MILVGDCVELMAAMPDASVDAVVTDPPYGLEFMGKEWDKFKTGRGEAYSKGGDLTHTDFKNLGTLPQYVSRPAKRCANCGKQAWSGSPCQCETPRWVLDNSPLHAFQAWCETWATEILRVLKPGGHLLAFGGTRTYHRLACAVEDAGFEIRDTLCWLYGSGFPKSLDVSKAIDKAAGVERAAVLVPTKPGNLPEQAGDLALGATGMTDVSEPVTPEAERWQGWGTALKPAHEPIVVARKPLGGTVAANVLEHGTGALNVDGCRIEGEAASFVDRREVKTNDVYGKFEPADYDGSKGRWPANVVLDEEAAQLLDAQTGVLTSGPESDKGHRRNSDRAANRNAYGGFQGQEVTGVLYGDSGGASRFFYVAKASRAERNAGLEGFAKRPLLWSSGEQSPGTFQADGTERAARNNHPTVKPVALMRWLVRLVTPPDGLVLDPFAGSGTTGIACALEGFEFTGCEQDADYAKIAEARIAWWAEHGEEALRIVAEREKAEAERESVRDAGQLELL